MIIINSIIEVIRNILNDESSVFSTLFIFDFVIKNSPPLSTSISIKSSFTIVPLLTSSNYGSAELYVSGDDLFFTGSKTASGLCHYDSKTGVVTTLFASGRNTDFDLHNCASSLKMFDIECLPIEDENIPLYQF